MYACMRLTCLHVHRTPIHLCLRMCVCILKPFSGSVARCSKPLHCELRQECLLSRNWHKSSPLVAVTTIAAVPGPGVVAVAAPYNLISLLLYNMISQ